VDSFPAYLLATAFLAASSTAEGIRAAVLAFPAFLVTCPWGACLVDLPWVACLVDLP